MSCYPLLKYCGSQNGGWINGCHPENFGENITHHVCFFYQYGSPCQPDQGHLREKIIIKNCGDFYSYFLTETSSSWVATYCGMEKEHIDGSCTISTTTTSFTTPTTTMSSKCTYKGDGYCDDSLNNKENCFDRETGLKVATTLLKHIRDFIYPKTHTSMLAGMLSKRQKYHLERLILTLESNETTPLTFQKFCQQ